MNDRLNNIEATMELLGGIGRTTVFELLRSGELQSVRVRRRRMVPQSQIDAYISRQLEQGRRSTLPNPAAQFESRTSGLRLDRRAATEPTGA